MLSYTLLAACDSNFLIGIGNRLPWPSNKADFRHFVNSTSGAWIVMTRNTYNGIKNKTFLNRKVIVVHYSEFGTFFREEPNCTHLKIKRGESISKRVNDFILSTEQTTRWSDKVVICGGPTLYDHYIKQTTYYIQPVITYILTPYTLVQKNTWDALYYLPIIPADKFSITSISTIDTGVFLVHYTNTCTSTYELHYNRALNDIMTNGYYNKKVFTHSIYASLPYISARDVSFAINPSVVTTEIITKVTTYDNDKASLLFKLKPNTLYDFSNEVERRDIIKGVSIIVSYSSLGNRCVSLYVSLTSVEWYNEFPALMAKAGTFLAILANKTDSVAKDVTLTWDKATLCETATRTPLASEFIATPPILGIDSDGTYKLIGYRPRVKNNVDQTN